MEYTTRTWGKLTGELCGDYQAKNMNTILNAVKYLTLAKNKGTSIKYGISHVTELTGLMGRWQKIQDRPLVICDTGHNVGGWQYLAPQIKAQACRQLRIVFGMVDDKDVTTVMKMLPKDAIYYWTQATTKRAIKVEKSRN